MIYVKPALQSDSTLNRIRGKNSVGHATPEDIAVLFAHLDALEMKLDEADGDDTFGTEGWREFFGVPE